MNKVLKKRILISPELAKASVGIFFQSCNYELSVEYKADETYEFIVNDFHPEIKNIPRLQTVKNLDPSCFDQVRAYVDERILESKEGQALLNRYFGDSVDFSAADFYSSQYKNIYTIKIQDYLNVGYFIDTIVVQAYKNKFDHDIIREHLNTSLPRCLKIIESQEGVPLLEVSFAHSEDGFAVQICFDSSVTAFKKDLESLKEYSSLTNFFDLTYFSKRQKAIFSSVWFKSADLKSTRSYFLTEVASKNLDGQQTSDLQALEGPDSSVVYEPQKTAADQSKKLQLARKFSLFIKNIREKEENPKDTSSLEIADIDTYLKRYPRQAALKELDDEIKNFIIKLLKDEKLYQGVSDYIQKIAQSNLDSHVEEIQKVISEKSLEEVTEIFKVAGSKDESGNEKTVVGGWTENLNEEEWKVKRSELVEQIKEEVTVIKSQGRNVIEDDIVRVVSNQLQTNPDEVKTIVKGFVEEAVTTTLIKKEKLEEAFTRAFNNTPAAVQALPQDPNKEKLEQQVLRMKKLMEQMKNELLRVKAEKAVQLEKMTALSGEGEDPQVVDLKRALEASLELAKNKDKMAHKLKADLEKILQSKNEKIASLETRIESLKTEFAHSAQFANQEKLEKLEVENRSLQTRLELANRKINIISQNMDKQDSDANLKKDREVQTLKTNMQLAQSMIEKMKQDQLELENKLHEEREKNAKVKDQKESEVGKEKNIEQEILISSLTTDKKSLEEKLKLQSVELKKLEQKLKFTTAKLEDTQKKKGGAAAPAGNKSNEAYIKQLEQANSRLADATSDLAEKKKEVHRYKQENAIMSAKVAELEKKLANLEKKAA